MWDDNAESYDPDVEALQGLEAKGFEIGYHLGGSELAGYDLAKAPVIVARDVAWFRERFNLRTFVPHGGGPGRGRLNNVHFPHEGPLADLVWGMICSASSSFRVGATVRLKSSPLSTRA